MAAVIRVLAIADETAPALSVPAIKDLGADIVVSCGDLPFSYVDYVASAANRPLLFVPGNHDPSLERDPVPRLEPWDFDKEWGNPLDPPGGHNLDGRIIEERGLTFAGLGGSMRYRPGANQYSEREMRWRVAKLEAKWWRRRLRGKGRIDVLVTHSPARDVGDLPDPAHSGFAAFHRLLHRLEPQVMIHGHIHPHGFERPEHVVGDARVVNVVPYRIVEVMP
jgi:predicted phosphodiesterase